jgi:cytoskeletal protein RodZ
VIATTTTVTNDLKLLHIQQNDQSWQQYQHTEQVQGKSYYTKKGETNKNTDNCIPVDLYETKDNY